MSEPIGIDSLPRTMARAYSADMRERVIARVESGASRREAAEHYEVSASTAVIWVKCFRETSGWSAMCRRGTGRQITLVAALRRHGMRAAQTIDGAMTGKRFLAYVERCLAPTLRPKDIVMIRQPSRPQGCRRPRGDRSARRNTLSAQIFARPEPDRDVLQ
jgi:transposase-like protein